MPRVKLLGLAITSSHGTLEAGDIVNVSDEFAAHLVNDCRVAEYLDVAEPTDTPETPETPVTPEAKKPRKTPKQAFEDAEQTAEQPAPEQAAPVDDAIDTEGE